MKNKKTIYHFIIDKSGSMQGSETETIAGFNTNLKTVQDLETEFKEQEYAVSLTFLMIRYFRLSKMLNQLH